MSVHLFSRSSFILIFLGLNSLLQPSLCRSQVLEIDSLYIQLKHDTLTDLEKIETLNKLASSYRYVLPDSAVKFARLALSLSKKNDQLDGLAKSLYHLGTLYYLSDAHDSALVYLKESLIYMEKVGDVKGANNVHGNIGSVHYIQGDYPRALVQYQKVLETSEIAGHGDMLGTAYNNSGMIYQSIGDYSAAMYNYERSLRSKIEHSQDDKLSITYTNIGIINSELGQYEEAMEYFNRSIELNIRFQNKAGIAEDNQQIGTLLVKKRAFDEAVPYLLRAKHLYKELGKPSGVGRSLNQIGCINLQKGKLRLDSAIFYFEKSLAIHDSIDDNRGKMVSLCNLAKSYLISEQYDHAIDYANEALSIAENLNAKKNISKLCELLFQIYSQQKKQGKALEYLIKHKLYRDSVLNEIEMKKIVDIQTKYKLERVLEDNLELASKGRIQALLLDKKQTQLTNQKMIILGSVLVFGLMSLGTTIIYRLYKVKNRAYDLLQKMNAQISSQRDEIKRINESLESKVQERTDEILKKNERLEKFTFSISHQVRAPLANIMSLTELMSKEMHASSECLELNKLLTVSANKLDQVLRDINNVIDSKLS